jgi:hypothetical protein
VSGPGPARTPKALGKKAPPAQSPGSGASSQSCLIQLPSIGLPVIGQVGGGCMFSKTQARAVVGAGVLILGGVTFLIGTVILAAYGLKASGAATATGRGLEATGAAVGAVPGAQAAGAGIAGAGRTTARAGQAGAAQRVQRRRVRRAQNAAEDRELAERGATPVTRGGKTRPKAIPRSAAKTHPGRKTGSIKAENIDNPPF